MGLIGQQRASCLVDIRIALVRPQRINVRRVARVGVHQLAQVIQIGCQQRRQRRDRLCGDARLPGRKLRLALHAIWHQCKRCRRHINARQRRQQQCRQHPTPHLRVPALVYAAAQRLRNLPPAPNAPDQQHHARNTQEKHRQGHHTHHRPARRVKKQRAVQVFHPARKPRRCMGGNALAADRVDTVSARLVIAGVINNDRARGRALNLLDIGVMLRHPARQRCHADLTVCGYRGLEPLQRRV